MSVIRTMEDVIRYAPTHKVHLCVAATVDTLSQVMEGPVWMTMSVH